MIPDYLDLFDRHDAEQARAMARLPKCSICGERIQDECLYDINGEIICEDCLKREFRRFTDDYME